MSVRDTPTSDSTTQRLREIGAELDRIHADIDKPLRRGRWLRGLQARSRKLAATTLSNLPGADRRRQRTWIETALALLKPQYDGWTARLDAIRERVKTDDPAK